MGRRRLIACAPPSMKDRGVSRSASSGAVRRPASTIPDGLGDVALWPPLRQGVTLAAAAAVLDAMEAEHLQIDPLLSQVDASLAARGAGLEENAAALAAALETHMSHEEAEALPLVESRLGPEGWARFIKAIRERQGVKGAAEFLPWLLDDAPAETSQRVLGGLPAPVRILYRTIWRPGYSRTTRWTTLPA